MGYPSSLIMPCSLANSASASGLTAISVHPRYAARGRRRRRHDRSERRSSRGADGVRHEQESVGRHLPGETTVDSRRWQFAALLSASLLILPVVACLPRSSRWRAGVLLDVRPINPILAAAAPTHPTSQPTRTTSYSPRRHRPTRHHSRPEQPHTHHGGTDPPDITADPNDVILAAAAPTTRHHSRPEQPHTRRGGAVHPTPQPTRTTSYSPRRHQPPDITADPNDVILAAAAPTTRHHSRPKRRHTRRGAPATDITADPNDVILATEHQHTVAGGSTTRISRSTRPGRQDAREAAVGHLDNDRSLAPVLRPEPSGHRFATSRGLLGGGKRTAPAEPDPTIIAEAPPPVTPESVAGCGPTRRADPTIIAEAPHQ
jgi:hypothetical protein